ncbi:MAG: PspA/IM30 family protein [Aphanothece sp. CMT-3BRIN-NPC111]|jgi:phage shock protein A|nr:PspA/IM30 family protein [Aphanothece sp. CMT-3BRIN-NPC111]
MKRITLKKILYWFIGETAGRSSVAVWKWLWGLPVEPGGKIAEKVAQESLQSMQQSVVQLTAAVARVVAAYEQAKQKYNRKQEEFYQSEKQAQLAYGQGNQEAARLAITKAIMVEKILPQLSQQVAKAEKLMIAAKEKLNREREKVEAYKLEMINIQALSEMNQAMKDIVNITTELDIESSRSQFEEAQGAIEGRYLRENAQAELLENPTEKLEAQVNQLTLDEEINRRLQQL